jgi:UDP-N-acetylglucosamine/UDP-N-acetylgalactosamine diphosphorylase
MYLANLYTGTLPCLSMEGQVLLDKPFAIAVAPDGNGGLYAATRAPLSPSNPKHTVLSDLASRGIDYIHAYSVDNCLVRVADPVFLGYSITKQADCAAKVVRKTKPDEAVGVVAIKDDKFSVVEYSEISFEQAGRRDASGELAFRAANIANHFYTASFLNDVESFEKEMAYHIALKKIPHVDQDRNSPTHGKQIKHTKPNGMKLELFVFDVFPFAKHMVVLEVDRKEEFSPLKNADATTPGAKAADSPTTSREDLVAQHKRYLEKAGAKVGENVAIEISPLVTYAGEGLEKVKGKSYEKSFEKSVEVLDQL